MPKIHTETMVNTSDHRLRNIGIVMLIIAILLGASIGFLLYQVFTRNGTTEEYNDQQLSLKISSSSASLSTTQDFPSTTQDFPSTTHNFPLTTHGFPPTTQDFPSTSQDFPSTTHDFPLTTHEFPPTTQDFPSTTQGFPSTTQDFLSTTQDFAERTSGSTQASTTPEFSPAQDCKDVLQSGLSNSTGMHRVYVDVNGTLEMLDVFCDMDTDGGGWTVFQKRSDGSVDFYRDFSEYESGFGYLDGEFWLGLKWLHYMTKFRPQELRIDLVHVDETEGHVTYSSFSVGPPESYQLHVSGFTGSLAYSDGTQRKPKSKLLHLLEQDVTPVDTCTMPNLAQLAKWIFDAMTLMQKHKPVLHVTFGDYGDTLLRVVLKPPSAEDWLYYNNGSSFTTYDRDQDERGENCAVRFQSGFWHKSCSFSNLNGKYQLAIGDEDWMRFYWYQGNGPLAFSEMKFRKLPFNARRKVDNALG